MDTEVRRTENQSVSTEHLRHFSFRCFQFSVVHIKICETHKKKKTDFIIHTAVQVNQYQYCIVFSLVVQRNLRAGTTM